MQGQEINLKWKSFHSNILQSFENLWEEEGLVDVTLASDGRCIKAHKVMLSASSPFFKMIFETNPCRHPVIVLQDVHFTELESILSFVYKGEVNILQENLPNLLRAAETLQIRGLCGQAQARNDGEKVTKEPAVNNIKTPPSSPKPPIKKLRNNQFQLVTSPARAYTPAGGLTMPVSPEQIKCEPRGESPSLSEESCGESTATIPKNTNDLETEADHLGSSNANDSAYDLSQVSKNFPFPPFPCPFCERAYTSWGFRRRHIKACHTQTQRLPCKWCMEVLPSHTDWESHVCTRHSLSRSDARNGLLILEEAEVVLQIPQPTRLDALVTMIKEQKQAEGCNEEECNRMDDSVEDGRPSSQ